MLYQLSYKATHWERGQFIESYLPVAREMSGRWKWRMIIAENSPIWTIGKKNSTNARHTCLGSEIRQNTCIILWCKTMRLKRRIQRLCLRSPKARVDLDGYFDSLQWTQTCSINLQVDQSCEGSHKGEEREGGLFFLPPILCSLSVLGISIPVGSQALTFQLRKPLQKCFWCSYMLFQNPEKLANSIILHI